MATITGACFHQEVANNQTFNIDTSTVGTSTVYLVGSGNTAVIGSEGANNTNVYVFGADTNGTTLDGSQSQTGATNQLVGGLGNDTLIASINGATDKLIGGGGADTFEFGVGAGTHTITDFTMAQNDVIQLASALIPGGAAGLNNFLTANATDNAGGVMLNLGTSDTLQINGLSKATLIANQGSIFHVV